MNPKREEKLVIDCLIHQGYTEIEFEPDGNIPPDILVNNRIAIEVRRLNQNKITEEGFKGLEVDGFSVHGIMSEILRKSSDENFDKSAFVGYYFNRPIPTKKEIKKYASEILEKHKSIIDEEREYILNENFRMKIFPSETKLTHQYQYGMSSDYDLGGFIVSLIYKNLKLIIPEKEEKISKFRERYSEWWLAVVDKIGYGLSELDSKQFHSLPKIENNFNRLLLVSAINSKSFRYLYE
jgi:hypothetical protein